MDKTSTYTLPNLSSVNCNNGYEIAAYSHMMLSLLQRSDRFCCGTQPIASSKQLLRSAKLWIETIESRVEHIPAHEAIVALNGFDFIHRLAYGHAASGKLIGNCYMKAFEEHVKGDNRIGETDLFIAVSERLRLRDKTFFGKPLKWFGLTLDEWYNQCRYTGEFRDRPLDIALQQAGSLISQDLYAFTGRDQESVKRMIADRYVPTIAVNGSENGMTLYAKLAFLRHNRDRFDSFEQTEKIEQDLLLALSQSPEVCPLDRMAFALDAEFKNVLAKAM